MPLQIVAVFSRSFRQSVRGVSDATELPYPPMVGHAHGMKSNWPTTSRHTRGYGSAWDKRRDQVLKRDSYLCQCDVCKAEDRTLLATEVNHIISKAEAIRKGWTQEQMDAMSNLQSVNSECHKRITQAQQGKAYRPRPWIGADGFPVTRDGLIARIKR